MHPEQSAGTVTTPARSERRPWSALAVVVLFFVGLAGLSSLAPLDPNFGRDPAGSIALICAFAAFASVGGLVIWQRPSNTLGWIMAAIGLLASWGASADTYADIAYTAGQRSDPLFLVSVWVSLWYWYPLLGLVLIFTPLLFPNGRPPSRRWRPVVWASALCLALITFLAAFRDRVEFPGISIDNPVGIQGVANPEQSRLGSVLFGFFFALLLLALVSVGVRYYWSRGIERHQIKWLLLASLLAVLLIVLEEVVGTSWESEVPFAVSVALLPTAIAVAILRYRLYDIDVIINRTLVYGLLTILLGATYYGSVVVLQQSLRAFTGEESSLVVVASTLGIAVLFNPLRRRVQAFIDRRFYRRKYDARKTLEAFAARLRQETELETLNNELVDVVKETVQPAHLSLWLRPDTATKSKQAD